jgi:hypothetical protein
MRNTRNNYNKPTANDRLQWKTERLAMVGQLITNNTSDTSLQFGLITEHIDGSCYKVLVNGQELYASHNKSKNLWKLWSDK